MSVISLFSQSPIIQLLLSSVALLFVFYAMGRVIQNRFKFNKSNIFISTPIGMFAFLILNQIIYTPAISLGGITDENLIIVLDYIKAFGLILFIAITYKEWMPKFTLNGIRSISLSLISIAIVLFIYYGMSIADPNNYLIIESPSWLEGGGSGFDIGNDLLTDIIRKYQSTIRWIIITCDNTNASVEQVLKIQMSLIWITTITFSIQSAIVNNEKSITSFILATLLSVIVAILLGYTSPSDENFYVFSFTVMLTLLLYEYSKRKAPSETYITFIILGSVVYLTIGDSSIILLLLMGFLGLILTSIKGGNIVRSTVHYLGILVGSLAYYMVIIFLGDLSKISSAIAYLLLMLMILVFFLLPMYALGYNPSRRKDLVKFERGIKNGIRRGAISTAILLIVFSFIINFINSTKTIDLLANYFIEFNIINNELIIGIWLYMLVILLPSILILINWKDGKTSNLLGIFSVFSLLSNPIVISTLCNLLSIEFTNEIVLLPSILLLIVAALSEITKRIEPLH